MSRSFINNLVLAGLLIVSALASSSHAKDLLLLGTGQAATVSGFVETLLTDTTVRTEPALPTYPAAGGKYTDAVFGTQILRVTDAVNEPDVGSEKGANVAYSYWPSLNSNNTRIQFRVRAGYSRARFYTFDPITFTSSATGTLLSSPPAGLQEYGLVWDSNEPDIIYGPGNYVLSRINVADNTSSTLKSFSGRGHSGGYITQISKSKDDNCFAGSYETAGTPNGYWVWKRDTDTVLLENTSKASLDEVQIDKTCAYLTIKIVGGNAEVWDLGTGLQVGSTLTGNTAFNHSDTGDDTAVTHRPANTSLGYRSLATPTTITDLLPCLTNGWSYTTRQDHFSMTATNQLWMVASRYKSDGSGVTAAFDNEIVQVATDGSCRVRRIAHHRSIATNYESQPKANSSMDGQFVVFTSNMGNSTGRRDVFVVKIQAAPTQ